jgi:S-ribosylhomocysteine lyase
MKKIPSFQKNHDTLCTGLHAQTDENGITTFDLRFKKPNAGDYLSPKTLHTIEHLLATVLRNGEHAQNVVYFGPMGCRTGFYLLTLRLSFGEVLRFLKESVTAALALEEIPGAKREECGNYLEHDLQDAKRELKEYLTVLENLK